MVRMRGMSVLQLSPESGPASIASKADERNEHVAVLVISTDVSEATVWPPMIGKAKSRNL